MSKKIEKQKKDRYGRLVNVTDFESYWDEYQRTDDLSMSESIRQKEERLKKLKSK